MKIILASDLSFLLKYGYELTGISKPAMKIGYIVTAVKHARNKKFFEDTKIAMGQNNIDFEEIDIEGKNKYELMTQLEDKNIIHVEGGNTFYLLKSLRQSGFSEIIREFLGTGKVYIGTSAGAYVMCPTIEVADWDESGRDRFGVTDFSALHYVPFLLKVHYTDEKKTKIIEKMKTLKYPLRVLKDGQGIFVENNTYTFIGDEETVL